MPLFTKFKKAKDAANEHKKTTAIEQAKPPATPYKHVPTHAKQDALAVQPTTVRPEELQARIAAARKKRATSWQSSVSSRHSVYHSCESSRSSSRTSSTAHFVSHSSPPSLRAKERSAESIDTILGRPHPPSQRRSLPASTVQPPPNEMNDLNLNGPPVFHFPGPQRPRPVPTRSRRSSFTMKRSPLSHVSVEEEPDDILSSSSNTSNTSTQSSSTYNSVRDDSKQYKVRADSVALDRSQQSKPTIPDTSKPAIQPLIRQRSKWNLFQRKSTDVTAH
ncbi:hypothetical protein DE146DRAFT_605401 [Phaeosphaeria sp. MPI-PUGE-AT-0046c]|nr:hypothetical protein DE146DRAFT_605401 [Phaeosphaeria sp. MPI-PUGE-AT-0046c]